LIPTDIENLKFKLDDNGKKADIKKLVLSDKELKLP
jgi:hypothetical protein